MLQRYYLNKHEKIWILWIWRKHNVCGIDTKFYEFVINYTYWIGGQINIIINHIFISWCIIRGVATNLSGCHPLLFSYSRNILLGLLQRMLSFISKTKKNVFAPTAGAKIANAFQTNSSSQT